MNGSVGVPLSCCKTPTAPTSHPNHRICRLSREKRRSTSRRCSCTSRTRRFMSLWASPPPVKPFAKRAPRIVFFCGFCLQWMNADSSTTPNAPSTGLWFLGCCPTGRAYADDERRHVLPLRCRGLFGVGPRDVSILKVLRERDAHFFGSFFWRTLPQSWPFRPIKSRYSFVAGEPEPVFLCPQLLTPDTTAGNTRSNFVGWFLRNFSLNLSNLSVLAEKHRFDWLAFFLNPRRSAVAHLPAADHVYFVWCCIAGAFDAGELAVLDALKDSSVSAVRLRFAKVRQVTYSVMCHCVNRPPSADTRARAYTHVALACVEVAP